MNKEITRTLAGFALALATLLSLSFNNNSYASKKVDSANGDKDIRVLDTLYSITRNDGARKDYFCNANLRNTDARDTDARNGELRKENSNDRDTLDSYDPADSNTNDFTTCAC